MTARDRFTEELKCPVCGREGVAQLSQEDGYSFVFGDQSTRIDHMPDGFKRVDNKDAPHGFEIHCAEHNVPA